MLFLRRRMLEIGLDLTLQLQRQRVALTVACVSRSHPYPPFADAIFLHIGLFHALEANAYAPLQKRRVMIGAARVDREAVWRNIGHLGLLDVRTNARGQIDEQFRHANEVHESSPRIPEPGPSRNSADPGRESYEG